jgi:hypothetical protein
LLLFPQTSPLFPLFQNFYLCLLPCFSSFPRLMSDSSFFYIFSQTSQLIFRLFQTIISPIIMPHRFHSL